MSIQDGLDLLASINLNLSTDLSFSKTSDKQYDQLQRWINVTSYSMLDTLHSCPRKLQLIKSRAAGGGSQRSNVDFAYGHCVGAGIQNWLHTRDIDVALFNGFLAWNIDYSAEIEKKKKSIWNALLAVQKFPQFFELALDDWDIWVLPSGKPAIELAVEVDFENGFKHYIHIDAILKNRRSGQFAVYENKTSGFKTVDEALYANSNQALGYAAVLDAIQDNTTFEVFYGIYSTTEREWQLMPFTKSTTMKVDWLNDVRLDQATINTYHQLNFWPKRGSSCFDFMRRCEFFGECNMVNHLPELGWMPAERQAEEVDFSFTLSQLLEKQAERIAS